MPRGTIRLTPGSIILPLVAETPTFDIFIIDNDGTETSILDCVISVNVDQTSREAIWGATVTVANVDGQFTGRFTGGETLVIKADYSAGDELQFRGIIDDESKSVTANDGFTLTWTARQAPQFIDETSTLQFFNTLATDTIKGDTGDVDSDGNFEDGVLFETGVVWDPDNIDSDTSDRVFASYQKRKKWDIIRDICERFDYDCYIYFNEVADDTHLANTFYFKMFKEGTITNSAESIVWGRNLLLANNIGRDNTKVKNRILLTGTDADGDLLLRRDDNITSQAELGVKELHIDDSSVVTMSEAESTAANLLAFHSVARLGGALRSLGLVTLRPGEKINVFIPNMELNADFTVRDIAHSMSAEGWTSDVQLEEPETALTQFFRANEAIQLGLRPYSNFNAMTDSISLTFDQITDADNFIGSKTNISISDSFASLTTPSSDGVIISETLTTVNDMTEIELRVVGNEDIDDSEYEVTTNNGISFISIPFPLSKPFVVPAGKLIKLKVILKSTVANPDPKFQTVRLLLKG